MNFVYISINIILIIVFESNQLNITYQVPTWKTQACKNVSDGHGTYNKNYQYVCDKYGNVICSSGWQGDLCNVPICRKGCDPMNGYCNRPNQCHCKIGYHGDTCNNCITLPGCKEGYCRKPFECICKPGWKGLFCSQAKCLKGCSNTGGFCNDPDECKCLLGWKGPLCNMCEVLPGCQHGDCTSPFECKCFTGYTGLLCSTPVCQTNCNKHHGYCKRPGECRCKIGWMGESCSKCHPYPGCLHGDCVKPWDCNCKEGWGGILCDEELNYCSKNPDTCKNNGKCVSKIKEDGNFHCECRNSHMGRFCETPVQFNTTSSESEQII